MLVSWGSPAILSRDRLLLIEIHVYCTLLTVGSKNVVRQPIGARYKLSGDLSFESTRLTNNTEASNSLLH
jgi:hypothetical protein